MMNINRDKKQTVMVWLMAAVLILGAATASWCRAQKLAKVIYAEHLDDVAVTVDDIEYRFRDIAFYLAYEERMVQEQAEVYDLKDTNEYWNLRTDHSYIRQDAKNLAMDMAVHDAIFYQMALEEKIELTEEEEAYMSNQKMDFWNDLEEEGQQKLGVSEEEIEEVFYHMALAQKQQQLTADSKGVDYREYEVDGSAYEVLLEEHTYQINKKLWERLNFGKITLD